MDLPAAAGRMGQMEARARTVLREVPESPGSARSSALKIGSGVLRSTRAPIWSASTPTRSRESEDLNRELRLFASPGEYEPANFIVYPLKDLSAQKSP